MPSVRIKFNEIESVNIIDIDGGITANNIVSQYRPDAFINLALYDMASKENIVKLVDENIESGYLFSDKGIGVTSEGRPIWCSLAEAKTNPDITDYVSGAPVLVTEGKVNIDWGNKVSTQIQGKHIRSAVGISDNELILYTSSSSITLESLACNMIDLGCKYAINCDGGGSSHLQNGKTIYQNSVRANPTWLLVYKKREESTVAKKPIVVLDAGYGSSTSGKRSPDGKFLEYKFNRVMVDKVAKLLSDTNNFEVIKTCPTDYDLSLNGRCKIANDANADLFISIHANASAKADWDSAKGWECYVCAKGGKAEQLANKLKNQVQNLIPDVTMRGVKVAKFSVLINTDMPAVLIESGFMNNKEEVAKLSDDSYQNKLAMAYATAIANQLGINLAITDSKETETVSSFDWALTVLEANGVITSSEYWKNNKDKVQYLEQLIINMGKYIEDNK